MLALVDCNYFYELVEEGRLERHPDLPVRVTSESGCREAARRKDG